MKSVQRGLRTIPTFRSLAFLRSLLQHPTAVSGRQTNTTRIRALATQAFPLTGFYQLLLEHPQIPSEHPAYYPSKSGAVPVQPSISSSSTETSPDNQLTRTQLVFGSRLVGPLRVRMDDGNGQAQLIAGVLVPPKPKEPDNCCMSGCVNCVWDVFREDLEEWAAANYKAQRALLGQYQVKRPSMNTRNSEVISERAITEEVHKVDLWGQGQGATLGLGIWEGLEDIPIGIRVFMDTEKAIKSRKPNRRKDGGTPDVDD